LASPKKRSVLATGSSSFFPRYPKKAAVLAYGPNGSPKKRGMLPLGPTKTPRTPKKKAILAYGPPQKPERPVLSYDPPSPESPKKRARPAHCQLLDEEQALPFVESVNLVSLRDEDLDVHAMKPMPPFHFSTNHELLSTPAPLVPR